jgi:hypothetical protein
MFTNRKTEGKKSRDTVPLTSVPLDIHVKRRYLKGQSHHMAWMDISMSGEETAAGFKNF